MERNLNSFNNFSNQSNTFGSFASNPRSESNSPFVWLNDTKVTGYDLNNQETVEGLGSNQNTALTSYSGGQFGLGQRLHGLRRSGNTFISFPEVRKPLFIARNDLAQSQPRALVPVGGFTQNARNSLIASTYLNSPTSTSTNILNRPICQNPAVFVSNHMASCCCSCHMATSSYFLGLGQNSSHHLYPNHRSGQNPMKPNSTIDIVLSQRQVHQGNVFDATPIPHLQTPNNNVDWGTSTASVSKAEPISVWFRKRKMNEQVQTSQNQPWNRVSLNENVGDQNNVSADARPVVYPVGDIFLGNDGRTHSISQWKEDPCTCPCCKVKTQSSQTSATHMAAEDYKHEPTERRLKRTTRKYRGRSNHMYHPSDVVTQVQAMPHFKQTSTSGMKVPTDQTKNHIAEALKLMDADQSGENTASQGDPSPTFAVDDQKKLIDFLFDNEE